MMFKKKLKPLALALPMKEAEATLSAFKKEVAESAEKHGVDCYALLVEFYALNDKGERGSWMGRQSIGSDLRVILLLAWAYGLFRGSIENVIDQAKQHGINSVSGR